MRVHNPASVLTLSPMHQHTLGLLRQQRRFDVTLWVDAKVRLIESYFQKSGLNAAVLGVSGGIDSALALALLAQTARQPGSALKKIVPLALPAHAHEGVTGQGEALARARELGARVGWPIMEVNVAPAALDLQHRLEAQLGVHGQAWSAGQLVPYTRTPALYGAASLLTEAGFGALVAGTTNRDEGAYLGYVGKASDAMVDLQLISDLHKSEVRLASRMLGVPDSILQVTPTGDMFDGRVDEEVFGAPYDAVEMLLLSRTLWTRAQWKDATVQWDDASREQWVDWEAHLEKLHRHNAHKYAVGSPAVHLDVWASAAPGGWSSAPFVPKSIPQGALAQVFAAPSHLPQPSLLGCVTQAFSSKTPEANREKNTLNVAETIQAHWAEEDKRSQLGVMWMPVLKAEEAEQWVAHLETVKSVPAPRNGRWSAGVQGERAHSQRATMVNPGMAQALWEALGAVLPPVMMWHENDWMGSDLDACAIWRPIGINPVFRGIRYDEQGALDAHYDAPEILGPNHRTLLSVVLYLSDTQACGGALRFLKDEQWALPSGERDFSDGPQASDDQSPLLTLLPKAGDVVVFEHRRRHDVGPMKAGALKWILRTDVIFERCGRGPLGEPTIDHNAWPASV